MKKYYLFFLIFIPLCVIVVIFQTVMSSGYAADQKKETDLQQLNGDVDNQGAQNDVLPQQLSQVKLSSKLEGKLTDYTYSVKSYDQYQLCATFAHEHQQPAETPTYINNGAVITSTDGSPDTTYHGAGHQCFAFTATGIDQPTAATGTLVPYASGSLTCDTGARDQKWSLGVEWTSYDPTAKTATVQSGSGSQTFRWCADPVATTMNGTEISMAAIPAGTNVTLSVVSPGLVKTDGTVVFAQPYFTNVHETQAVSVH